MNGFLNMKHVKKTWVVKKKV